MKRSEQSDPLRFYSMMRSDSDDEFFKLTPEEITEQIENAEKFYNAVKAYLDSK